MPPAPLPPSPPANGPPARRLRLAAALALLSGASALAAHAALAGAASVLYHRAKYGAARADRDASVRSVAAAHRLYGVNANACIWAAQTALDAAMAVPAGAERDRRVAEAEAWCDRGLRLNVRSRSLRAIKTDLLKQRSPDEAIAYWRAYLEWEYWRPANHLRLADLLAEKGDWAGAEAALSVLQGRPEFAPASKRLAAARRRGN